MSTHPNAILLLVLTPDETARKTFRAIKEACGVQDDNNIKIEGVEYHVEVMEGDYNDGYQITAAEGDIIVFDFLTYGYGERIEWSKLIERQAELSKWAEGICERHKCSAKFYVTANYW